MVPPDADEGADLRERRIVAVVNDVRGAGTWCAGQWYPPVPPLHWEPRLAQAARDHCHNMATRGYIDHVDHWGRSPFARIQAAGYGFEFAGENLSAGKASPEEVVAWWIESPGHCANLMHPRFLDTGVGYAAAEDAYGHYWAQTFGRLFPA